MAEIHWERIQDVGYTVFRSEVDVTHPGFALLGKNVVTCEHPPPPPPPSIPPFLNGCIMSGPVGNSSHSTHTFRYQTHNEGDEKAYKELPPELREAFDGVVEKIKELIPAWDSNTKLQPFGLRSHPGCPAQGHKHDGKPLSAICFASVSS